MFVVICIADIKLASFVHLIHNLVVHKFCIYSCLYFLSINSAFHKIQPIHNTAFHVHQQESLLVFLFQVKVTSDRMASAAKPAALVSLRIILRLEFRSYHFSKYLLMLR